MATDSVMGLFTDPQQYQQAQNQAALQRGIDLAQLDPFQRASAQLYQGGYMAGGAIGGALGGQDPQLQMATARKQIMQGVDQTDPQSLAKAAQALNQAGDIQGARALAQAAQEAAVKQSQVVRNLREKPASSTELEKLQDLRAELVTQFGENDPRVKEVSAAIAKKTTGGGIGSEIAAGLAPLVGAVAGAQAKKMGEAGGTEVGKQVANVQGKYTALGSIKDAVDMLDKGIYSGGYGPMQEAAAKYAGGILRKDRLANTQEFRAYIGDVVIPRLQEFGGNDSVEELNYLRSVMAGDTSMEGTAIKNILQKADRKIRAGIDRIEKQQTAVTTGKPLPVGDTATTPKATKRFNPQTGQLEVVK
jgi:hypothetical protein